MNGAVFAQVRAVLERRGLRIIDEDLARPWGGYYVLDEEQLEEFVQAYFPHLELPSGTGRPAMSPKVLMVAPGRRLSWQYHHRRTEEWRVLQGPVAVASSPSDAEVEPQTYETGAVISTEQGTRHRLCGLRDWGVVAEIWVHTDPAAPSTEDDIVRLQDDYFRAAA